MGFWEEVVVEVGIKMVYEHGFNHAREGRPRRDYGYRTAALRAAYNRGYEDGLMHRAIDALSNDH